jgi:hypothetical protein
MTAAREESFSESASDQRNSQEAPRLFQFEIQVEFLDHLPLIGARAWSGRLLNRNGLETGHTRERVTSPRSHHHFRMFKAARDGSE